MATQEEAADAIYAAIVKAAKEAGEMSNRRLAAAAVRDVAIAYRAVAGGPQPGGSVEVHTNG